jgi:hypothetical protein
MIWVSGRYARDAGILSPDGAMAIRWVWDRADWSAYRNEICCQLAARCAQYMAQEIGWLRKADLIELALSTRLCHRLSSSGAGGHVDEEARASSIAGVRLSGVRPSVHDRPLCL